MASSSTLTTVAPTASVHVGEGSSDESLGDFYLLDDVFRLRAADKVQIPLVAFPKSDRAVPEFEYLTAQDLDRFIDLAAKYYTEAKLKAVIPRTLLPKVELMLISRYRMTRRELLCSDIQIWIGSFQHSACKGLVMQF